jgi:hypothetical protein
MSHVHHERLAWDSARTVVTAIEANYWPWLAYQLGERIAPELREHVVDSFVRLNNRPEQFSAEVGIWRAVLTDVLNSRPHTSEVLADLMAETRHQMQMPVAV